MTTMRSAIHPGWDLALTVAPGLRLLRYPDGRWAFQHPCKMLGPEEQLVCGPLLQVESGGHTVTDNGGLAITVTPSILCPDCGTHGFITDGAWRSC